MKTQEPDRKDSFCPQCGSGKISFDESYGFYKCQDCNHVWGYDSDDPDYEEEDDLSEQVERV